MRIQTKYDYDIKKEVFEISGDVGYARSTDTLLVAGDVVKSHIEYYEQEFMVEVVGDLGNSKIIIYDNDTVIPVYINNIEYTMINYTDVSSQIRFKVRLNYDAEHNIQAKYKGNDDCLASKSRKIMIQEAYPDEYKSTITRTNNTVRYDADSDVNVNLRYNSGENLISAGVKPIKIYVDEELYNTLNINMSANSSTGTGSISVSGLDDGLHIIKAVFEGDAYNTYAELEYQVSVGYIVTATFPEYVLNNDSLNISVLITDYFENAVGVAGLTSLRNVKSNTQLGDIISHVDGVCEIEANSTNFSGMVVDTGLPAQPKLRFRLRSVVNSKIYYSENYEVTWCPYAEIDLTADKTVTAKSKAVNLTGKVMTVGRAVPIKFTGGINETIYSNNIGVFKAKYVGQGAGDVEITATTGNVSKTIELEDLLQYYVAQSTYNKFDYNRIGEVVEASRGLLFNQNSSTIPSLYITDENTLNKDFTVEFDVISMNAPVLVLAGNYENGTLYITPTQYNKLQGISETNKITITCEENIVEVMQGSTVLFSGSYDNSQPFAIGIGNNDSNYPNTVINNIKMKVIG